MMSAAPFVMRPHHAIGPLHVRPHNYLEMVIRPLLWRRRFRHASASSAGDIYSLLNTHTHIHIVSAPWITRPKTRGPKIECMVTQKRDRQGDESRPVHPSHACNGTLGKDFSLPPVLGILDLSSFANPHIEGTCRIRYATAAKPFDRSPGNT
jgi:hypothetical protein